MKKSNHLRVFYRDLLRNLKPFLKLKGNKNHHHQQPISRNSVGVVGSENNSSKNGRNQSKKRNLENPIIVTINTMLKNGLVSDIFPDLLKLSFFYDQSSPMIVKDQAPSSSSSTTFKKSDPFRTPKDFSDEIMKNPLHAIRKAFRKGTNDDLNIYFNSILRKVNRFTFTSKKLTNHFHPQLPADIIQTALLISVLNNGSSDNNIEMLFKQYYDTLFSEIHQLLTSKHPELQSMERDQFTNRELLAISSIIYQAFNKVEMTRPKGQNMAVFVDDFFDLQNANSGPHPILAPLLFSSIMHQVNVKYKIPIVSCITPEHLFFVFFQSSSSSLLPNVLTPSTSSNNAKDLKFDDMKKMDREHYKRFNPTVLVEEWMSFGQEGSEIVTIKYDEDNNQLKAFNQTTNKEEWTMILPPSNNRLYFNKSAHQLFTYHGNRRSGKKLESIRITLHKDELVFPINENLPSHFQQPLYTVIVQKGKNYPKKLYIPLKQADKCFYSYSSNQVVEVITPWEWIHERRTVFSPIEIFSQARVGHFYSRLMEGCAQEKSDQRYWHVLSEIFEFVCNSEKGIKRIHYSTQYQQQILS